MKKRTATQKLVDAASGVLAQWLREIEVTKPEVHKAIAEAVSQGAKIALTVAAGAKGVAGVRCTLHQAGQAVELFRIEPSDIESTNEQFMRLH